MKLASLVLAPLLMASQAGCSSTNKLPADSGMTPEDLGAVSEAGLDAGQATDTGPVDLGEPTDVGVDIGPDLGMGDGAVADASLDAGVGGWPAEARSEAEKPFNTAPKSMVGQNNWSGAHYNPVTEQLWLVRDLFEIRVYDVTPNGFTFNARYPMFVDFEGITQTDYSRASEVFVLAENETQLQRYDFSVAATASTTWDLLSLLGMTGDLEGLAFVPDALLASSGFVDGSGVPFAASRGGYGGLMLISHQRGGDVFALDLAPNGSFTLVGRYRCPLSKTRGLELDRESGLLYMVDGDGSARVRLSSTGGTLDVVDAWPEPGPDGAEGIAVTPGSAATQWIVITDDDNLDGDAAALWYRDFSP